MRAWHGARARSSVAPRVFVRSPTSRIATFAFTVSLLACDDAGRVREWRPSDHAQPPEVTGNPVRTPSVTPEEARAQAGSALFRMQCAACHGAGGRGDGPAAMGMNPPDLTLAAMHERVSDADLATVIRSGRGAMPAFGAMIDDAGIAALVGHLRSLRASVPTPSPVQ